MSSLFFLDALSMILEIYKQSVNDPWSWVRFKLS